MGQKNKGGGQQKKKGCKVQGRGVGGFASWQKVSGQKALIHKLQNVFRSNGRAVAEEYAREHGLLDELAQILVKPVVKQSFTVADSTETAGKNAEPEPTPVQEPPSVKLKRRLGLL